MLMNARHLNCINNAFTIFLLETFRNICHMSNKAKKIILIFFDRWQMWQLSVRQFLPSLFTKTEESDNGFRSGNRHGLLEANRRPKQLNIATAKAFRSNVSRSVFEIMRSFLSPLGRYIVRNTARLPRLSIRCSIRS